jgi:hypothetical protein
MEPFSGREDCLKVFGLGSFMSRLDKVSTVTRERRVRHNLES